MHEGRDAGPAGVESPAPPMRGDLRADAQVNGMVPRGQTGGEGTHRGKVGPVVALVGKGMTDESGRTGTVRRALMVSMQNATASASLSGW